MQEPQQNQRSRETAPLRSRRRRFAGRRSSRILPLLQLRFCFSHGPIPHELAISAETWAMAVNQMREGTRSGIRLAPQSHSNRRPFG